MREKTERTGKGRRGGLRRLFLLGTFLALAATAYLVGGFLRFAEEVASLHAPASISDADGIVVLTGGAERLGRAVELLRNGDGQRLLISGVNPDTGVRSLARVTGADPSLFECCVDLDYAALDTVGNAQMTVRWAAEHGIERLVLVTSDYHIPRSMIEIEGIEGAPEIVPYPVSPEKLWQGDGRPTALGARLLLTEYAKVIAAKARLALGFDFPRAALGRVAARSTADHGDDRQGF